jgi:hypothetical protein
LISFADRTLAIIDPLKSSGLSPGKRPGSFGVPERRGETVAYRLIGRESLIGMHQQFIEIACHAERVCLVPLVGTQLGLLDRIDDPDCDLE